MDHPLRQPEEILAYRSLKQILAAKPRSLWTAGPKDSALTAMRLMAEKNIGLVVVTEHGAIAGVLSERDCVRQLVLVGKPPELTLVADIMIRDVIKVDVAKRFADCLKLMHRYRNSSLAGGSERHSHNRYLDPRPVGRGSRTPRQGHRRT